VPRLSLTNVPDTNPMTTLSTPLLPSPSASFHDQYPTNPPAALTVVLSIACGIVATCVLFTVRIQHPLKFPNHTTLIAQHSLTRTTTTTLAPPVKTDHPLAPTSSLSQAGLPPRTATSTPPHLLSLQTQTRRRRSPRSSRGRRGVRKCTGPGRP
jgi:hypothetical protein